LTAALLACNNPLDGAARIVTGAALSAVDAAAPRATEAEPFRGV
jgi:hypothetical protein